MPPDDREDFPLSLPKPMLAFLWGSDKPQRSVRGRGATLRTWEIVVPEVFNSRWLVKPGSIDFRHVSMTLDDQPSAVVKHFRLDQPFGC